MTYIELPKSDDPDMMYVITKWYKNAGDHVNAGDMLVCYEAEKSAIDIESPCDGVIKEICVPEDVPAKAGTVICIIE